MARTTNSLPVVTRPDGGRVHLSAAAPTTKHVVAFDDQRFSDGGGERLAPLTGLRGAFCGELACGAAFRIAGTYADGTKHVPFACRAIVAAVRESGWIEWESTGVVTFGESSPGQGATP